MTVRKGDQGLLFKIGEEYVFLEKSLIKNNDQVIIANTGDDLLVHGNSNIKAGDTVILQPTIDDIIALKGGFLCHEETEWVWILHEGPSGARDWFTSSDYRWPIQLWSNIFSVLLSCYRKVKWQVEWEHCVTDSFGILLDPTPNPFGTPDAIEQGVDQSEIMKQAYLERITRPNYLTESQPTSNPFGENNICRGIGEYDYNMICYYNSIYYPRVVAGPGIIRLRYDLKGTPWPASQGQTVHWRGAHGPWKVAIEVPLRSLSEGDVYFEEPPF